MSAAGFKYYVTEMVCCAAGGTQQYSGRTMGDSHCHLMITNEEWQAFMDDFQQTLNRFEVPSQNKKIKAIVESTKESIVVRPLQREQRKSNCHGAHLLQFSRCVASLMDCSRVLFSNDDTIFRIGGGVDLLA